MKDALKPAVNNNQNPNRITNRQRIITIVDLVYLDTPNSRLCLNMFNLLRLLHTGVCTLQVDIYTSYRHGRVQRYNGALGTGKAGNTITPVCCRGRFAAWFIRVALRYCISTPGAPASPLFSPTTICGILCVACSEKSTNTRVCLTLKSTVHSTVNHFVEL